MLNGFIKCPFETNMDVEWTCLCPFDIHVDVEWTYMIFIKHAHGT
jgi:hypothetical protein